MTIVASFEKVLSPAERRAFAQLSSPIRIQEFLDSLAYNPEEGRFLSPLSVLREGMAHCFEGSVFAALALKKLGYRPLLVNMFPEEGTDDEHLLAVFRRKGGWGAVAKSNFVGLRYREPVYRDVRELVMSYFEQYYNVAKKRTLRSYTRPLSLEKFNSHHWPTSDEAMNRIDQRLDSLKRIPLLTRSMVDELIPVDERSYQSGLSGSNPAGLYKPT